MKIPSALIEKFTVPEKDESVTPMKKIWLDVEGERLIATDGHVAIRQTATIEDGDVTGLIPVEAFDLARKELKAISKATKGDLPDPWLKVTCGEDSIVIQNLMTNTTHLVTRPALEKGQTFPNVDAVFGKFKSKPSVTLSGDLLARLINTVGTEGLALSFWIEADDKVVNVATATGKALAAVMPMRPSDPDLLEVSRRGAAIGQASASEGRDPQRRSPEATGA